jgi:hypothetical protein
MRKKERSVARIRIHLGTLGGSAGRFDKQGAAADIVHFLAAEFARTRSNPYGNDRIRLTAFHQPAFLGWHHALALHRCPIPTDYKVWD